MQDEREKKPGRETPPEKPPEKPPGERAGEKAPPSPAGPHARPDLTNEEATPGTGSLPDGRRGGDADPGSG